MTPDEIRRRFPNASRDVFAANAPGAGESSKLECPASKGTLATIKAQEVDPRSFFVRITSIRKRLLDEDNLASKYHTDCLRYAGLLPSDAPAQTRIETRQRKTNKGEEEHTVVELYATN